MRDITPQKPGAIPEPPERIDWTTHALFLDFDGTLTPLRDRPEDVVLHAAVGRLLTRALDATEGAVAVISGRSMADLHGLLPQDRLTLSGSHGAELWRPGREADTDTPSEDTLAREAEMLDGARAELEPFAEAEGLLLERKPGAVALHYRNRPDLSDTCRTRLERVADRAGLRVMHGNMVSEAVLRDHDKGTALRGFLAEPPFLGRRPVMIGDDTTDEDGFRAAQEEGGFGLRIGGAETLAHYRVPRLEDALGWLSNTLNDETERRPEWTWE